MDVETRNRRLCHVVIYAIVCFLLVIPMVMLADSVLVDSHSIKVEHSQEVHSHYNPFWIDGLHAVAHGLDGCLGFEPNATQPCECDNRTMTEVHTHVDWNGEMPTIFVLVPSNCTNPLRVEISGEPRWLTFVGAVIGIFIIQFVIVTCCCMRLKCTCNVTVVSDKSDQREGIALSGRQSAGYQSVAND